tara:strand:- start:1917 stop:3932 length:2016 start_codon:yes stop_codon:yes gene_type:complete
MADDSQDVFITGVGGNVAQWSTEATATQMAAALTRIGSQNTKIIGLLTKMIGGQSVTVKQAGKAIGEGAKLQRSIDKQTAKDTTNSSTTQRVLRDIDKKFSGFGSLFDGLNNTMGKQLVQEKKTTKAVERLMKASGMSEGDARATIEADNKAKEQMNFLKKAVTSIASVSLMAEEATNAGFQERFDMASELRQSGLMNGLSGMNEGMIDISKTISETGFTFGQAAEFTKSFSEAVGVKGVKATLDFVNNMAQGPTGLMEQFSLEFGQVAHLSGEYLESLRLSGQLNRMSDQQQRIGMDSFMSNVQATSNVLKVSMEEAASIMKNALTDEQRGMLLTLPDQMQTSLKAGMEFMGGMNNPLAELITTRLGAGANQFMQTEQFQEMSGSQAGQELIKFTNQAANVLETQGDAAFQEFMAGQGSGFIDSLIETFSSSQNRGVAFTDGTMALIGQLAAFQQTLSEADQGISGGDRADTVETRRREGQRQASVGYEDAFNSLMPGFIDNVENLTETNRRFAETARDTITENANLIDGFSNATTGVKQLVVETGTVVTKLLQFPAFVLDGVGSVFGTNVLSNDGRSAQDFTKAGKSGRTISNSQMKNFEEYTNDMIEKISKDKNATSAQKKADYETLIKSLSTLMVTQTADGSDANSINQTQQKILASLNTLINQLKN